MTTTLDYSVEPKSRSDLRRLAFQIREVLELNNNLYFPIVESLDVLEETLSGFSYSIVPDNALPPNKHATIDIYTGEICIKESVYEGARHGCGRDRMTIAHEVAHFMTLCFLGFRLYRTVGDKKVKTYEDPEWQAKCLAGELLIPYELTIGMSVDEIIRKCGVSRLAAKYRKRF